MLSKTLWRLCRGDEAEQAAREAVMVLEALPPGPELAWAYANLSAFHGDVGDVDQTIEVGEKARDLGERLHQHDVVSHALNTMGCALADQGRDGMGAIEQALRIALDADLQEAAGRAYCNLQSVGTGLNRFAEAERYYAEGMAYCEERELGVFSTCLMGGRADALLLTGQWDEAADICSQMLNRQRISPVNRLNPLLVMGSILARRGEAGAWELLDEALALAEGTGEPHWIVPVRTARVELRWLSGEPGRAVQEGRSGYDRALGQVDPWMFGSIAIWLRRLLAPADLPSGLPEPFALEMAGDWPGAAAAWQRLGRPTTRLWPGLAQQTRLGSGKP